jgi:hypothetical protein
MTRNERLRGIAAAVAITLFFGAACRASAPQQNTQAPGYPVETSVSGFLVNTGAKLVLIDTGAGTFFGPTLGKLLSNLRWPR